MSIGQCPMSIGHPCFSLFAFQRRVKRFETTLNLKLWQYIVWKSILGPFYGNAFHVLCPLQRRSDLPTKAMEASCLKPFWVAFPTSLLFKSTADKISMHISLESFPLNNIMQIYFHIWQQTSVSGAPMCKMGRQVSQAEPVHYLGNNLFSQVLWKQWVIS